MVAASQRADCHSALGRDVEAAATVNTYVKHVAAQKHIVAEWVTLMLYTRLRSLSQARDADGCRTTVEMGENREFKTADRLYDLACFRAVAAEAGEKQAAEADADRAMAWLANAGSAGDKDAKRMAEDDDLAHLRDRDDYKKRLASIRVIVITPAIAPLPRPVATR